MRFVNDPDLGVMIPDYETPDDPEANNVTDEEGVEVDEFGYDELDGDEGTIGQDMGNTLPIPGNVRILSQTVSTAADGRQTITVQFGVDGVEGYAVEARLV